MTSDSAKKKWIEFFKLYEQRPCLWDKRDDNYKDQFQRRQAYKELLPLYRRINKEGSMADLKKKLDHFRSAFNRQCKRIYAAINKGEKVKITLWHYKHLKFLLKTGNCAIKDGSETYTHYECLEDYEEYDYDVKADPEYDAIYDKTSDCENNEDETDKSMANERTYLNNSNVYNGSFGNVTNCTQNEAESFGRTIGMQLEELNIEQKNIAEKLISEIVFYGRFNKLNESAIIDFNGIARKYS